MNLELLLALRDALATGIGAVPVFARRQNAEALKLDRSASPRGVMAVAAIAGLLFPALDEGEPVEVGLGLAVGVAFLLVGGTSARPRRRRAASAATRTWALVFLDLLVHSLPEGFAIGTAYASNMEGLGLFIVVAIAIQNSPEGTSMAIPMATAGYGRSGSSWAAATSIPQPVGAVVAFLLVEEVTALLPVSFAFAAGAMLALVVIRAGARW